MRVFNLLLSAFAVAVIAVPHDIVERDLVPRQVVNCEARSSSQCITPSGQRVTQTCVGGSKGYADCNAECAVSVMVFTQL